ncbi:cytochrome b [Methylosinus sp. PW1]|uniref:cytochrome b n=1 Tax=Methylosinus sp. PW1 TaxID=107636 RepID=UPI00055E28D9|nr:cytochrome b [Methylosinus sp. PW1]
MTQSMQHRQRYGAMAQGLHWLSALAVAIAWGLGLLGGQFPKGSPRETAEFAHVVAGEVVVAMLVLRLIWRFIDPPPPASPSAMGRAADLAAKLGHLALYALLLAVPAVGVATLFASGDALSIFGVGDFPSPWVKDRAFEHSLEEIHEILAHSLIALSAVHAVAAVIHHRIYRDDTLKRMLPPAILR